jgi:hypothetical protein
MHLRPVGTTRCQRQRLKFSEESTVRGRRTFRVESNRWAQLRPTTGYQLNDVSRQPMFLALCMCRWSTSIS